MKPNVEKNESAESQGHFIDINDLMQLGPKLREEKRLEKKHQKEMERERLTPVDNFGTKPFEEFISTRELRRRLRITPQVAFRLRAAGLPHLAIGKKFLYEWEEVVNWLRARKVQ